MTTAHRSAESAQQQERPAREAKVRPDIQARNGSPSREVAALLRLQRTAGNAAVSALLASRVTEPETAVQREADSGVAAGLRGQADRLMATTPPGEGGAADGQASKSPPTPEQVAAKKAELRSALPVPSEAAAQAPRIQEAARAVRNDAKAPAEPLVPAKSVPKPDAGAGAAATAAASLASQADAIVAPETVSAPPSVVPPEPLPLVDAGGAPLPRDPGADIATAGLAQRVQQLRLGGLSLREHAAQQVAVAHNIRGRIQLGMSRVAEAESGIGTLKEHTDHRRQVAGQARSALEVSEQKAETVSQQAPGIASKGSEGKQKSGPMAGEAGNLSSQSAGKRPDDADAAAKSQEQGQKLAKVSGDITSMDTAIGQTQTRAEGLVEDAAQAKTKNAASRSKIEQTEATLAQTDAKVAEMTGQNETAKTQLTGLAAGPGQMLAQAAAVDSQGQAAIQASVALEQRLHQNETAFREGMGSVPARPAPVAANPVQRQAAQGARATVDLGSGAPAWLTGADPVTEQQRQAAKAREHQRQRAEIAEINQQAGGHFQNLDAGDKASIALRMTGRHLMGGVGATSIPGLIGGVIRGFIDPRVSLMGVVHGLSMVVSGVANLFSAEQWAKDPLGNLLQSSADIATGVAIVLGSIAGLAVAIIVILTALTILSFGALGPVAAAVIPFCSTVAATVGPWALTAAEIALVLQGLLLIKNLIDAATASTSEELQSKGDEMTADTQAAGQMAAQIGMAKLGEAVMGGGGEGEGGGGGGEGGGAPPVEGGAPPVEGGAPPVEGGAPPVEGGGAPVEGGAPPVEGGGAPPVEGGGAPPVEGGGAPPTPPEPPSGLELDTGPPGGTPAKPTVLEPHPVEVTPEGELRPVPGPQEVPIPDTPGAGQPASGLELDTTPPGGQSTSASTETPQPSTETPAPAEEGGASDQSAAERDWDSAKKAADAQDAAKAAEEDPGRTEHGAIQEQERGQITPEQSAKLGEALPRVQSDGAVAKVIQTGRNNYLVEIRTPEGRLVTVIPNKTGLEVEGLSSRYVWDPPWLR